MKFTKLLVTGLMILVLSIRAQAQCTGTLSTNITYLDCDGTVIYNNDDHIPTTPKTKWHRMSAGNITACSNTPLIGSITATVPPSATLYFQIPEGATASGFAYTGANTLTMTLQSGSDKMYIYTNPSSTACATGTITCNISLTNCSKFVLPQTLAMPGQPQTVDIYFSSYISSNGGTTRTVPSGSNDELETDPDNPLSPGCHRLYRCLPHC